MNLKRSMNKKTVLAYVGSLASLAGMFYVTHSMIATLYLLIGEVIGVMVLGVDARQHYHYIRTVLFLVILLPLSVFVASSTGNTIGQGVVCALLLGLFAEMVELYHQPAEFNRRFMSASKPWEDQEIRYGVVVFGMVTAIVCGITVL
jgi:hypothetical protein